MNNLSKNVRHTFSENLTRTIGRRSRKDKKKMRKAVRIPSPSMKAPKIQKK
jgi:hypothetical protein